MDTTIVVAKYNEDIKWTKMLKGDFNLIVYDKDPRQTHESGQSQDSGHEHVCLPNIGREAHTYLHHIVSNWDNLAEHTIFLQGWPFDHFVKMEHIQKAIDDKVDQVSQIGTMSYLYCDRFGHPDYPNKPIGEYFTKILKREPPELIYFTLHGAQFIVNKKCIKNKSLDFWKDLLKMSETIEDFPWIIERLWLYIFMKEEEST